MHTRFLTPLICTLILISCATEAPQTNSLDAEYDAMVQEYTDFTCSRNRLKLLQIGEKNCHTDVQNTLKDTMRVCMQGVMGDAQSAARHRNACVREHLTRYMQNIAEWDREKGNETQ